MVGKSVYLELAGWTQVRWFQFGWQCPEHHDQGPAGTRLLHSVRPEQGIGFGHVSVVELLYHLCDRCVWACHAQWARVCCCLLPDSWLTRGWGWGWHSGQACSLGALLACGLPPEPQGGMRVFCLWPWTPWHCLICFPGISFGLGFGKVRSFLLCFQ